MGKLTEVQMLPGILTTHTDRGAKNRWKDGDHVRFFRGNTQKIGGWIKAAETSFLGVCRGLKDWLSLAQRPLIALGTHLKLYIYDAGTFFDITPIRASGTFANNPITTTNTSVLVSIHHVAHGAAVGDYVTIAGATAVGGITIAGNYAVTSVTDVDNYVITHSAAATSGANGGGAAVTYAYEIAIGYASTTLGLGWGAGGWGVSTWGTARSGSTFVGLCRTWSMDNWGEDLIVNPRGGAIYVWDASTGTSARAVVISGAPATAKSILVSSEDRHLIALGAHDGSVDDPLLIRWCASEDYTDFAPTALNDAGRKRLDGGNEIYCGIKVGKEILVMTDTTLTTMIFSGPPYTFDFNTRGLNGGLASPNAAVSFDGRGWWMGEKDFFTYDGNMRVIPCDVRNHVFDDFNASQKAKVYAGANSVFGEVWWVYPSANSTENDRYVIYNVWENHWTIGTITRSALIADSKVFDPYAAGNDGYLYSHENGVNDNVSSLDVSLSSWDMEIGSGDDIMFMSKFIPDFKVLVGSVSFSITGKKYPHSTDGVTQDVGVISSSTEYASPRMRCRQISLSFMTEHVDDDFGIGTMRVEIEPDGHQ
jgi:hypothetical protein